MTTTFDRAMPVTATKPGILDLERIIAAAGFNRWLVPPQRSVSISASAWPTAFPCSGRRCRGLLA